MEKEKKQEIKEEITIEWLNKDECNVTMDVENPIKDKDGNTIGTSSKKNVQKSTANEILEGIEEIKGRIVKSQQTIKQLEKQLADMGKIPEKTPEIVRLKKNLDSLQAIIQSDQAKNKLKAQELQVKLDSEALEKHKKMLEDRPTK